MIRVNLLFVLIMLVMVSCGTSPNEGTEEELNIGKDPEDKLNSDGPIPVEGEGSSLMYGKGVMLFESLPVTFYPSPLAQSDPVKVILAEAGELAIEGKPNKTLDLFTVGTEYMPNALVWKSGGGENAPKEVVLNNQESAVWYHPQASENITFVTWKEHLKQQRFIFIKENSNNPIRKSPDLNAEKVGFPEFGLQGLIYKADDISSNWMSIYALHRDDPAGKNKQPLGWIQWHCEGVFQIQIVDDIFMESYYPED